MTPLPLPSQTLAWLNHAADAGQCDAQALLHLLARADKRDQDVAVFVDSYSSTIAALCRRLEALERGAKDPPTPAAPVDDGPVANALTVAEAALADVAEGLPDLPVEGSEPIEWAETRCAKKALAAIRPVMRQHGIRTSEFPPAAPAPAPTPSAALQRLIEAPIDARGYVDLSERKPAPAPAPAAPTPPPTALVERVANAMGPSTQAAMDTGELPFGNAYAAIREVAAWLDSQGHQASANVVRWRIDG
jgi:hypothetical protein